ncbi:hypothetical protein L1049_012236 [Liquidambar formosana]|uniref:Uncharacterized protein n=1 Tax=Liquidambar formosana TaxID=63359 RepID=A0AAP0RT95_LIQFO
MAVSVFKSTSKRGNLGISSSSSSSRTSTSSGTGRESTKNSPKKVPPRRSRSVSALSRTHLDMASDFLNKRDNPLFWSSGSPPDKGIESVNPIVVAKFDENAIGIAKFEEILSKSSVTNAKIGSGGGGGGDSRRGRSVLRNADVGNHYSGGRKEVGQSLSRTDTGRRGRSVSRHPASRGHHGTSESEVEQECNLSKSYRDRSNLNSASNNVEKVKLGRSSSQLSDHMMGPLTWSSQHLLFEPSDGSASSLSCSQIRNWEDGGSMSSFSEAEEKTIKAVFEQMKGDNLRGDTATSGIYETVRSEVRRAISDIHDDLESAIRRNSATDIANIKDADIPPDLVNAGGVELVLDIRREYAKELEQSQERARKLRADLALEEHRGEELSRILKELLPDPKTSNGHKSRPGRKTSIERRKMSKRLTEEAMAYFDECVSISTFDNSDFSSQEDPPLNLVGTTTPIGDGVSLPQESGSQGQPIHSHEGSSLTASSSSDVFTLDKVSPNVTDSEQGRKFQFSFTRKPTETFGLQDEIRNYVKNFEKDIEKDAVDSQIVKLNYYDVDEYNLQLSSQSLLFDKVFYKNRIEFGSLLLCGGGIAISVSPFASII